MKSKLQLIGIVLAAIVLWAFHAGAWTIDADGRLRLEANFRVPPNMAEIDHIKEQLVRAQRILCDATDGQVKLTDVKITGGHAAAQNADILLLPNHARAHAGDRIYLYRNFWFGDVIAHELGHLVFGLGDSYPEERRNDGCGIGPSFDADVRLDEQWHSIMQQSGWQWCRDTINNLTPNDYNPLWPRYACLRDSDCAPLDTACLQPECPAGASWVCPSPPPLMSELSVALNNDLRRGDGAAQCPAPRAGSILTLAGRLNPMEPMTFPTGGHAPRGCGNGQLDVSEQCDGFNLNGKSCASLGFSSGVLRCYPNCAFNTSACIPLATCGNGLADPGEVCFDQGPGWPSDINCASLGFSGWFPSDRSHLSCDPNCGLNLSRCPNAGLPLDLSSLESALATANAAAANLEVIDSLGRVQGNFALHRGQSSHLLHVLFEHYTEDTWRVHFFGRASEYGGSGGLHLIDLKSLEFEGSDLVSIDGEPAGPVTIELGGSATGPFIPGADGSVAPPVTLEVRLDGLIQETWRRVNGSIGESRIDQSLVSAGEPGTAEESQIGICFDQLLCQRGWNSGTGRFEATHQTLGQVAPQSDWEVMVNNLERLQETVGFTLIPPQENAVPEDVPPAIADCAHPDFATTGEPIQLDVTITEPDAVFMVIDRSGSMNDQETFPSGSGQTRLEYVKAAARAFVDLQHGQRMLVGQVSFCGEDQMTVKLGDCMPPATLDRDLIRISDTPLPPPAPGQPPEPSVTRAQFHQTIDGLVALGPTAIGTALKRTRDAFESFSGAAPSKAIILLTDGENTTGNEDPLEEAKVLAAQGVQIYTVPVGAAADRSLATEMAAAQTSIGGGQVRLFEASQGDEVPTIFFELFGRLRGESPALARTTSSVVLSTRCGSVEFPCRAGLDPVIMGGECFCLAPGEVPDEADFFTISVEEGAERLDFMLSSRNPLGNEWQPHFTLRSPSGATVLTETSASVRSHPLYRIASVSGPASGEWILEIRASSFDRQDSFVAVHIENPGPLCSLSASPTITDGTEAVTLTARAYYNGSEIGEGVHFTGTVMRPDGSQHGLPLFTKSSDPRGGFESSFPPSLFDGRGLYDVKVQCTVGAGAGFVAGEGLLRPDEIPPPARPEDAIVPFTREARVGFFVDVAEQPPLPPGDDCDNDGILNEDEPDGDTDGDGLPDICDEDADGDDIPDEVDPDPSNSFCRVPACPIANAGPDQIVECQANGSATVHLIGTGSSDPDGQALTFAWAAPVPLENATQPIASGVFPLGTSLATLTVSDGPNEAMDNAFVTVVDTTPPVLTPPPDMAAPTCGAVNIGQATAQDGCGGSVTVINNAPASFPAGKTVVTWRAIDQFGNVAVAMQIVTVGIGDNPNCCPPGTNRILGTSNNDTLIGTSGADCILGFGAQDTIKGLGGNDFLSGGDGDDIVEGGDGDDLVQGGSGQDVLRGGNGHDSLLGFDGDDQCYGGLGNDRIHGGQGQDKLYGEDGHDKLFGEDGDDRLEGGAGNDFLNGGGLHDVCIGGTGTNTFVLCERQQ